MKDKQKTLKKQIEKMTELLNDMLEYVWAFEVMPPRGDGAKQGCIEEWVDITSKVIEKVKVIRQKQIELIEEN